MERVMEGKLKSNVLFEKGFVYLKRTNSSKRVPNSLQLQISLPNTAQYNLKTVL